MAIAFEVTARDICGPPSGMGGHARERRQCCGFTSRACSRQSSRARSPSLRRHSSQLRRRSPPPRSRTTSNIFRYGNHQSMFIVTPAGVIATDPISERRPAKPYIDAIQAVTKAPIKYIIYSHSHFDHIAGGKPFKDLGATFVAQT